MDGEVVAGDSDAFFGTFAPSHDRRGRVGSGPDMREEVEFNGSFHGHRELIESLGPVKASRIERPHRSVLYEFACRRP